MAFFAAAMPFLQSAGAAILGSKLNRQNERNSQKDRYGFLESKGLTPQEIAGSSGSTGTSSSAGNVLGNQAAEMGKLKSQQAYDAKQRALDRQVAIRGQDTNLKTAEMSTGASRYSSDASAGASRYSSDNARQVAEMNNALSRDRFENVELPDALRRSVTDSPAWKRLQILAGMGVDNMIGTAIGNKYGLDPMDPDALRNMSPSDFRKMVTEIYGLQSNVFSETAGAATVVGNGAAEVGASVGRVLGR